MTVHFQVYVSQLIELNFDVKAANEIGFLLSKKLIKRELIIDQCTTFGCEKAFETKIVFNIAGGTHHAFSNSGEAFCLLNDQTIAA